MNREYLIMEFNNSYVIRKIEETKRAKELIMIQELKQIVPLSDMELLQLYHTSISIHQRKNQNNGNFLENEILSEELDKNNIPYQKQVTIDKSGIIVGLNEKKKLFSYFRFCNRRKYNRQINNRIYSD